AVHYRRIGSAVSRARPAPETWHTRDTPRQRGGVVAKPAGPPLTLIAPAGVSVLPSNLNSWISCSAMHWTSSRVVSLFHAAPWHQRPVLASATLWNFMPST